MGMTAASMLQKIKAAMPQPVQTSDPATAAAHSDAVMLAFCQGVIDEIQQNAVVTTDDAQGGVNTGTVA